MAQLRLSGQLLIYLMGSTLVETKMFLFSFLYFSPAITIFKHSWDLISMSFDDISL